jgi:HSP20 family protein
MILWSGWIPDGIRDIQDEINRIFDDVSGIGQGRFLSDRSWSPLLDIYRKPGEIVVIAELPGFESGMVSVNVSEDTLVLCGIRPEASVPGEIHSRIERNTGCFERTVPLPGPIDGANATAGFRNGLLRVVLPLVPAREPRRIVISGEDD